MSTMIRRLWGLRNLWEMWSRLKSRKTNGRELKQLRLRLEPLERRELLAVKLWTGLGSDTNWSTPTQWVDQGGTTSLLAPATGDDLYFLNTVSTISGTVTVTNKLTNDNIAAGTSFDSITFGGSGFVLTGNAITLGTTAGTTTMSATGAGTNTILNP